MKRIRESELILNPDGSIYHLHLKPGEISDWIITVGDQDRVEMISSYFDRIEIKRQHREFKTHTGYFKDKRITVMSTGIGPDNIDIVFNELDALVNIDFDSREVKTDHTTLNIVRVGTSGGLQPDVAIDSFVAADIGIGFDNLLHFYGNTDEIFDVHFAEEFVQHTQWHQANATPYIIHCDNVLREKFKDDDILSGITTTNVGFYGPQGRILRLKLQDDHLNEKIASFVYEGRKITNLEMETAAIYGMSKLLGHRALSLNVILANRANGTFSEDPNGAVDKLIQKTLDIIAS